MAAQTPGIQQLLQAEKKAAERVADARKRKLPNNVEKITYAKTSSSTRISLG